MASQEPLISIGDLAEATGISIDAIRVWEKRYGRPQPARLPSGHRRYTPDDVNWLRRVAEALSHGLRPAQVVKLSDDELEALLTAPCDVETAEVDPRLSELEDLVKSFRGGEIRRILDTEAASLGIRGAVIDLVAPLVTNIGRAWADGRLQVRHEHFLTEIVQDFLRIRRRDMPLATQGPGVALATLEGELHGLGVQMAALFAALAGARPIVLGAGTPSKEIACTATEAGAVAVGISVSLGTGGVETDRRLAELREHLPESTRLVVGGTGARGVRRGPRGIEYTDDLVAFESWVTALAEAE